MQYLLLYPYHSQLFDNNYVDDDTDKIHYYTTYCDTSIK